VEEMFSFWSTTLVLSFAQRVYFAENEYLNLCIRLAPAHMLDAGFKFKSVEYVDERICPD